MSVFTIGLSPIKQSSLETEGPRGSSVTQAERIRRRGDLAVEFSGPMKGAPGVHVSVLRGDLTLAPWAADHPEEHGIVVPHFTTEASPGGVGGAVLSRLGSRALDPYDRAASTRRFEYSDAHYTSPQEVGTRGAYPLIGVATAGIPSAQGAPGIVFRGAENAIRLAALKGLRSITFPALDTGIIGRSSDEQSAAAIFGAAKAVAASGVRIPEILIVIYDRPTPVKDHGRAAPFVEIAKEGWVYPSQEAATADVGGRKIDFDRWRAGIQTDLERLDKISERDRDKFRG